MMVNLYTDVSQAGNTIAISIRTEMWNPVYLFTIHRPIYMINLCWNAFSSRFSKPIRKGSLLMITFYNLVRCLKIPRNCVKLLKRQVPSLLIWNRQRTLNICAVNVTSMHRSGQLRLQNYGIDDVLIFQQEISEMQTGMQSGFRRLRTAMVGKEKVQPLSLFLW